MLIRHNMDLTVEQIDISILQFIYFVSTLYTYSDLIILVPHIIINYSYTLLL